jgi:hypothetical protein
MVEPNYADRPSATKVLVIFDKIFQEASIDITNTSIRQHKLNNFSMCKLHALLEKHKIDDVPVDVPEQIRNSIEEEMLKSLFSTKEAIHNKT